MGTLDRRSNNMMNIAQPSSVMKDGTDRVDLLYQYIAARELEQNFLG